MTRQPCEDEGCYTVIPDDPPPDPRQNSNAGLWLVLAAVLTYLALDYWLQKTRRPTISKKTQRFAKTRWWAKLAGMVGMFFFTWHMFFGGPL